MAYQVEQLRPLAYVVPLLFWLVAKRIAISKNDTAIWDKADVGAAFLAAALSYTIELPIVLANTSLTISQPYTWLYVAYHPANLLLFTILLFVVASAVWQAETDWPIPRELAPLDERYGGKGGRE